MSASRRKAAYNRSWAKKARLTRALERDREENTLGFDDGLELMNVSNVDLSELEADPNLEMVLEGLDEGEIAGLGEMPEVAGDQVVEQAEERQEVVSEVGDAEMEAAGGVSGGESEGGVSGGESEGGDVDVARELVYEFDADDLAEELEALQLQREWEERVVGVERDASHVLAKWALEVMIPRKHLTMLLKALRSVDPATLADLPKDGRTLLKTETEQVEHRIVSGMEYKDLGVKESLSTNLERYPRETRDAIETLEISLNVDGLPLFKSNGKGVWPLLCALHLEPMTVFPLSITYGKSKPGNLDFLIENVQALKELLQDGLQLDGRQISLKLRCIVCDAPARAFVKDIKNHNAYHGCERCTQKGFFARKDGAKGGRVTYPETRNLVPRTDASFRGMHDEAHHLHPFHTSPLLELGVDMCRDFPLDYMHQICLGVMRRLLLTWLRGPNRGRQFTRQNAGALDARLVAFAPSMPKEFARKPRATSELEHWKATEYRQFLLYTGHQVLEGLLADAHYMNFLSLSVACMILVCPDLVQRHLWYAKQLMTYFVETAKDLYGPTFLVYNVHMMMHVADDAARFGSLDQCSGFPFENYLFKLKRMVKSGKGVLNQMVNRLREHNSLPETRPARPTCHAISAKSPENAYILSNNRCGVVEGVVDEGPDGRQYYVHVYSNPQPLFKDPCKSVELGIYKFTPRAPNRPMSEGRYLSQRHFLHKAIKRDYPDRVVFQRILHSVQE